MNIIKNINYLSEEFFLLTVCFKAKDEQANIPLKALATTRPYSSSASLTKGIGLFSRGGNKGGGAVKETGVSPNI